MKSNFYSDTELQELGLKSYGKNVLISRKCSIYGAHNISVGDNVRIDDFCILSGNITIGNYVHISAYCALYGRAGITIGNFCGLSPRTTIFSASDDFSGEFMVSPMVPEHLTKLTAGPVVLNDFVQVGANSVVMPNVTFGTGAVCGVFSFVKNDLDAWTQNVGIPCRFLCQRKQNPIKLAEQITDMA
ncbi:MAG TPA: galactoside O-acetyltransferase [Alphaproteobacteria bacterium]|nr:galactoside O-acetyltransferase [Alphaproteobacteria bacterium]